MRTLILASLSLTACSDYDLTRPEKAHDDPDPVDSAEPDPEPSDDPDINVYPASIDFGYVAKNCKSDPIEVTITNQGKAELDVSSIELTGDAAAKFTLHVADATVPPLQYGDSYIFSLTFQPTAWVEYTVGIDVASNDPDEPVVGVPTVGVGAEDSIYEESFDQTYQDKVDVLLVVDNSCSMEESVNKLRTDFDNFMNVFDNLGLDYHLGVVTTDMDAPSESGKLQGTPTFIDDSYADPVGWVRDTANVGSNGSGDEKGLDAAKSALTDPLSSTTNQNFLRADSAIAIVLISDEPDSSSVSPAAFSSWFIGLRSDPTYTSFNAIVGDRGLGCWENFIEAMGGDQYIDVVDATDGVFESICSADFSTAATNIAQAAAGMTVVFPLTKTPSDVSGLTVDVDGVSIDYDALTGFSYESDTNAIRFHGDAVPEAGSHVEVAYPVGGGC